MYKNACGYEYQQQQQQRQKKKRCSDEKFGIA